MNDVFRLRQNPMREFRRLATAELDTAIAAATDPGMPPARCVLAARASCKKLRALLRLVGPALADYKRENAAIRDAAAGLAGAREATMLAKTLRRLEKSVPLSVPVDDLRRLRATIAAREPDHDTVSAMLAEFLAAILPVRERATGWRLVGDDEGVLARGAGKTYRRARRALRTAGAWSDAEDFHDARKHVKYHLNQLGMLPLGDDDTAERKRLASELSKALGRHHDLEALRLYVTANGYAESGDLLDRIIERQAGFATTSLALATGLFSETPRRWRTRLRSRLVS